MKMKEWGVVHVKQNECIHHDIKNENVKKWNLLDAAPEKIVQSETEIFLFLCFLDLLRPGLDLDWLLQLDLLLGQLLGLGQLAEEELAPGVGPAAEVGLPAAEVGLPREARSLAESLSS